MTPKPLFSAKQSNRCESTEILGKLVAGRFDSTLTRHQLTCYHNNAYWIQTVWAVNLTGANLTTSFFDGADLSDAILDDIRGDVYGAINVPEKYKHLKD